MGFRVAVLNDLAALAEGLTEEIATGLPSFSDLRVIARVVLGCPLLPRDRIQRNRV
jgi:hypothetical protein